MPSLEVCVGCVVSKDIPKCTRVKKLVLLLYKLKVQLRAAAQASSATTGFRANKPLCPKAPRIFSFSLPVCNIEFYRISTQPLPAKPKQLPKPLALVTPAPPAELDAPAQRCPWPGQDFPPGTNIRKKTITRLVATPRCSCPSQRQVVNARISSREFSWSDLSPCAQVRTWRQLWVSIRKYKIFTSRKAATAQGRLCKQTPERADLNLPLQAENTHDDGKCRYCKVELR